MQGARPPSKGKGGVGEGGKGQGGDSSTAYKGRGVRDEIAASYLYSDEYGSSGDEYDDGSFCPFEGYGYTESEGEESEWSEEAIGWGGDDDSPGPEERRAEEAERKPGARLAKREGHRYAATAAEKDGAGLGGDGIPPLDEAANAAASAPAPAQPRERASEEAAAEVEEVVEEEEERDQRHTGGRLARDSAPKGNARRPRAKATNHGRGKVPCRAGSTPDGSTPEMVSDDQQERPPHSQPSVYLVKAGSDGQHVLKPPPGFFAPTGAVPGGARREAMPPWMPPQIIQRADGSIIQMPGNVFGGAPPFMPMATAGSGVRAAGPSRGGGSDDGGKGRERGDAEAMRQAGIIEGPGGIFVPANQFYLDPNTGAWLALPPSQALSQQPTEPAPAASSASARARGEGEGGGKGGGKGGSEGGGEGGGGGQGGGQGEARAGSGPPGKARLPGLVPHPSHVPHPMLLADLDARFAAQAQASKLWPMAGMREPWIDRVAPECSAAESRAIEDDTKGSDVELRHAVAKKPRLGEEPQADAPATPIPDAGSQSKTPSPEVERTLSKTPSPKEEGGALETTSLDLPLPGQPPGQPPSQPPSQPQGTEEDSEETCQLLFRKYPPPKPKEPRTSAEDVPAEGSGKGQGHEEAKDSEPRAQQAGKAADGDVTGNSQASGQQGMAKEKSAFHVPSAPQTARSAAAEVSIGPRPPIASAMPLLPLSTGGVARSRPLLPTANGVPLAAAGPLAASALALETSPKGSAAESASATSAFPMAGQFFSTSGVMLPNVPAGGFMNFGFPPGGAFMNGGLGGLPGGLQAVRLPNGAITLAPSGLPGTMATAQPISHAIPISPGGDGGGGGGGGGGGSREPPAGMGGKQQQKQWVPSKSDLGRPAQASRRPAEPMLSSVPQDELAKFLLGLQLTRTDLLAMKEKGAMLPYEPTAYLVRLNMSSPGGRQGYLGLQVETVDGSDVHLVGIEQLSSNGMLVPHSTQIPYISNAPFTPAELADLSRRLKNGSMLDMPLSLARRRIGEKRALLVGAGASPGNMSAAPQHAAASASAPRVSENPPLADGTATQVSQQDADVRRSVGHDSEEGEEAGADEKEKTEEERADEKEETGEERGQEPAQREEPGEVRQGDDAVAAPLDADDTATGCAEGEARADTNGTAQEEHA